MMENHDKGCGFSKTMWWMTLLIAVLAVPAFGLVMAAMFPVTGLGQIFVFVLACWLCTYLGMRIMSNPKMSEIIGKKK